MMDIPIYVVTMYRGGDRMAYSYVTYASTGEEKALEAAETEKEFRGGKYEYEVVKCTSDHAIDPVVIKSSMP